MITLNTRSKVLAAAAFLMLVVASPCARAQGSVSPPEPDRPALFGILGITRGQTARINVTNLGLVTPPDPDSQNPVVAIPPPCRVLMAFVDSDGSPVRNSAGDPVRRVVILQQGQSASLQINGDVLVPRDQFRLNFRPIVVVASTDPAQLAPPCTPVLEIIDNLFGRTSFVYAGTPRFTSPPEPDRPLLFGMTGLGHLQTARISVSNVGLVSPPDPDAQNPVTNPAVPPPCRVMMTFVDSDGNVLRNNAGQPILRVVILQQGQSASLQINSDAFIGRDQLRFNVRPVVVVASTDPASLPPPCVPVLEVIDNLTARTSFVYGGTPRLTTPPDSESQQ